MGSTDPTSDAPLPPGVKRRVINGNVRYVLARPRMSWRAIALATAGGLMFVVGFCLVLFSESLARRLGWEEPHLDRLAYAAFGPLGGTLGFVGLVTALVSLFVRFHRKQVELSKKAAWFNETAVFFRVDEPTLRAVVVEVVGLGLLSPHRVDASEFDPGRYDERTDVSLLVGIEGGWLRTLTHQTPTAIGFVANELRRGFDIPPRDPPAGRLDGLIEDGRGRWVAWFNVTMIVGFGLALLLFYLIGVRPLADAPQWPRVTAKVIDSKVETVGTGKQRRTETHLAYAYEVDGEQYRGEGPGQFAQFAIDTIEFIRAQQEGAAIEVAVDPDHPRQSLAVPEGVRVMQTLCVGLVPAWLIWLALALYGLADVTRLHPHRKDFLDRDKTAAESVRLQAERRAKRGLR